MQKNREEMEIIAKSNDDYTVLMINQNRYLKGDFQTVNFIQNGVQ